MMGNEDGITIERPAGVTAPVETEVVADVPAQAESVEATQAPTEEPKAEPKRDERKDRAQERINKLVREREEAKERAERAETALKALQAQAPQRTAYATDLDFQAATVAHAARVGTIHAAKDQAEIGITESVARETAERDRAFAESVAAALTEMPDWHAVVSSSTVSVGDDALETIKESDHGVRIAYQLAKNPAQAEHIARLSPKAQVREILRMEAQFSTPRAPNTTKAPAPLETIRSSQLSADQEMKEWERRENERERNRRRGL